MTSLALDTRLVVLQGLGAKCQNWPVSTFVEVLLTQVCPSLSQFSGLTTSLPFYLITSLHTHTGNMDHLPSLGLFHIVLCK